jgi:hypothetical protein
MSGVWAFVALMVGQPELPAPAPLAPVRPPDAAVVLRLEVHVRGVLSVTDQAITLTAAEDVLDPHGTWRREERVWVLEFADGKKLRKQAQQLHQKVVQVEGTCRILGVRTLPYQRQLTLTVNPPRYATETGITSMLEVDRHVRVTTLEEVKPVEARPPS